MSRCPVLSRASGVQRTTSAMLSAPHVQCDTYRRAAGSMSWGTIGGREELAGGTRRPLRLTPKQLQEAGLVCRGPRFCRARPACSAPQVQCSAHHMCNAIHTSATPPQPHMTKKNAQHMCHDRCFFFFFASQATPARRTAPSKLRHVACPTTFARAGAHTKLHALLSPPHATQTPAGT